MRSQVKRIGNFDAKQKLQKVAHLGSRFGLTYEMEGLLREVIEPDHSMNPWSEEVRSRNRMVVVMLLGLGLRGRELLSLRIEDLDFNQKNISIRRHSGHLSDPRFHEHIVQMSQRDLPMSDYLAVIIGDYIVGERRNLIGERKHSFLLSASKDGSPLSWAALNNIFVAVRLKIPGVPPNFGPFLCRITWKERFDDSCDELGLPRLYQTAKRASVGT